MPERGKAETWIRSVLGDDIPEDKLQAALMVHIIACHGGDKTKKVKIKPAAEDYLYRSAVEVLTPETTHKLWSAHRDCGKHDLDPESGETAGSQGLQK